MLLLLGLPRDSLAGQVRLAAPKSKTVALPGAFAGLIDPDTGGFYTADPFGLGETFAFVVVLDSGASGNLLSDFDAGADFGLNIPLIGETYTDVGIGGAETFNVSEPTPLRLAGVNVGIDGAAVEANYSPFGEYKFQVEQPVSSSLPVSIVGTPVLNQYVMHVRPNDPPVNPLFPYIDLLQTDLLPSLPGNLPAANTISIELEYVDFVNDPAAPVHIDDNPVVPGVRVVDSRRAPNDQADPHDLVYDSGGSITVLGRDFATEVGIDLANEIPVDQVTVTGVGGEPRQLFGYRLDELILPVDGGHEMVFEDPVVFVPEAGTLPVDLPGIIGMNLFGPSFSQTDIFGFPLDTTPALFDHWYLDPFADRLVLVVRNDLTFAPPNGQVQLSGLGQTYLGPGNQPQDFDGLGPLGSALPLGWSATTGSATHTSITQTFPTRPSPAARTTRAKAATGRWPPETSIATPRTPCSFGPS